MPLYKKQQDIATDSQLQFFKGRQKSTKSSKNFVPQKFLAIYSIYRVLVLLNKLLPVYMKYTACGDSQVANIAQGEAECYICHETLIKRCIFYTNKAAVF